MGQMGQMWQRFCGHGKWKIFRHLVDDNDKDKESHTHNIVDAFHPWLSGVGIPRYLIHYLRVVDEEQNCSDD